MEKCWVVSTAVYWVLHWAVWRVYQRAEHWVVLMACHWAERTDDPKAAMKAFQMVAQKVAVRAARRVFHWAAKTADL